MAPVSHGRARAAVVAAVLALGLGACGGAVTERLVEEAAEAAGGNGVDMELDDEGGGLSVRGEDGEEFSFGTTTEVPGAIADVVPIPDGFQPQRTAEQSDDATHVVTVSGLVTADDPAGLVDGLEATMVADGWEVVTASDRNDELSARVLQRDDDSLTVHVVTDGDAASMTLTLTVGTDEDHG